MEMYTMLKICKPNWKDMTGYDFISVDEAAAYILKGTRFNYMFEPYLIVENDEDAPEAIFFQGITYMPQS